MKRFLVILTVAGTLISMSSFKPKDSISGKKDGINTAVQQSFTSMFRNVNDVKWTYKNNYFKASFTLNGQYITAFYDAEGKMLGATRSISPVQLPIALQTSLKNNYQTYWVSDLIEYSNEDGTTYYITVENSDVQLTLKSFSDESWSVYKKQRKS
jgi:hypothetical protein